ncbi:MAG: hypothetical protein HY812_04380 [Planctomycetes bacterium]|nr:hypothetical protein [Planctomycetota bacterium]
MSTTELVDGAQGTAGTLRRSLATWILLFALAGCVGLSAIFTAALLVEAHSPSMTRGRKRELVAEFLPTAIPVLAALAAVGLGLAILRCGSLQSALRGDRANRDGVRRRALRVVTIATVLALATPLLQALAGLAQDLGPSQLFATTARAATSTLGILSSALQEDVLLRWLPLEVVLLALPVFRARGGIRPAIVAGALSTALATFAHAAHEPGLPALEELLRYGLPKAPAAFVFAWVYLRRGIVEAWLTHAATNLAILLVLPLIVAIPSLSVTS